MEEREQEALRGKEDKDYGFPFVEVKPLAAIENQKSAPSQSVDLEAESSALELDTAAPVPSSNPIHFDRKETQKRNQTPLLITLVFMLAVILAVMAYFLYYTPQEEIIGKKSAIVQAETTQEVEPAADLLTSDTVTLETPLTSDIAEAEESQKETATASVTLSQPSPADVIGKLNLVESQGERPVYHLIVASLPNERIAREEAQVLMDRGKDIWMIYPAGNTKNFRLSVGSFGSFKSASEALPQAKNDFGESTWILKY